MQRLRTPEGAHGGARRTWTDSAVQALAAPSMESLTLTLVAAASKAKVIGVQSGPPQPAAAPAPAN
jgi:hypothetical protein